MRITTTNGGREVTFARAVDQVAHEHPALLQALVVRLLEELTSALNGTPVLQPKQLERILGYQFEVKSPEED